MLCALLFSQQLVGFVTEGLFASIARVHVWVLAQLVLFQARLVQLVVFQARLQAQQQSCKETWRAVCRPM
jgi:hypothetical protein